MTEKIGIAGLGLMGFALAERLAGQGAEVAGPATTPMFKDRVGRVAGRDDSVGFSISGVAKDAAVFRDAARQAGVKVATLEAHVLLIQSAMATGLGDCDLAHLIRHRLGLA